MGGGELHQIFGGGVQHVMKKMDPMASKVF